MLHPYKNRTLNEGQAVKVYRNLHNDMFSIVAIATGLVVAHSKTVQLKDAKFVVNASGRRRVLREKQKNVHAYVVGTFSGTAESTLKREAYYNPYKTATFVTSEGKPLLEARAVALQNRKLYYMQ